MSSFDKYCNQFFYCLVNYNRSDKLAAEQSELLCQDLAVYLPIGTIPVPLFDRGYRGGT